MMYEILNIWETYFYVGGGLMIFYLFTVAFVETVLAFTDMERPYYWNFKWILCGAFLIFTAWPAYILLFLFGSRRNQ